MSIPISPGFLLRNHYLIIRQLGHGGFGRTYLAKDQYRFDELCVLKEFAPQVQGSYGLKKSEELFEREAQTLYRLNHPQIPQFRELFREKINGQGYLFVVQDYVNGLNYRDLLHQRQQQKRQQQNSSFTEAEMLQLMRQILPVLAYIHERGVIHRDISPDNIIQRQSDGLPILIDFGGVKQIQAKIDSEVSPDHAYGTPATRLGKVGYAPDEQMRLGVVYPHSDLHALAATILVLLTAKEPQHLINPQDLTWNLQGVNINPQFAAILNKMLASQPRDRYPTAQAVLRALEAMQPTVQPLTQPPPHFAATLPVATTQPPLAVQPATAAPMATVQTQSQQLQATVKLSNSSFGKTILFVATTMAVMGFIGWFAGNWWVSRDSQQTVEETTDINLTEEQRQQKIVALQDNLEINTVFFTRLVDENFYQKYPEKSGKIIDNSSDNIWRERWLLVEEEVLYKLANLSLSSRKKLGRFNRNEINYWREEVNQLNVSSQALYDLSDAQFFYLFPEYSRKSSLLGLSIGQVWQGITADQLQELKARKTLEKIQFRYRTTSKTIQGTLKPGTGKVYIANLRLGQSLEINLRSPDNTTLLSIYTPVSGKSLLEDSPKTDWSSRTNYSGYYEFVIVSTAEEEIDYELTITAE